MVAGWPSCLLHQAPGGRLSVELAAKPPIPNRHPRPDVRSINSGASDNRLFVSSIASCRGGACRAHDTCQGGTHRQLQAIAGTGERERSPRNRHRQVSSIGGRWWPQIVILGESRPSVFLRSEEPPAPHSLLANWLSGTPAPKHDGLLRAHLGHHVERLASAWPVDK